MSGAPFEYSMSRRQALTLLGTSAIVPFDRIKAATSPSSDALHYLGLQEAARRIASRELSPVQLTQHMLDRIAQADAILKSYATIMGEQALADARAAEKEIQCGRYRGALHGVPIGVKDLCYTKGVRTMGGTAVLRNFVPTFDATVVSRLRAAGSRHADRARSRLCAEGNRRGSGGGY
ncbi:MAG: amidase [Gammaproteobacteria bacterium]|jgi:hypothetical protein|nr:amidase [Gammaproteobacteria bacterium]